MILPRECEGYRIPPVGPESSKVGLWNIDSTVVDIEQEWSADLSRPEPIES